MLKSSNSKARKLAAYRRLRNQYIREGASPAKIQSLLKRLKRK